MKRSIGLFIVVSFVLSACAAPPKSGTPLPKVADAWSVDAARGLDGSASPDARWWEGFGDEVLTDLVRRATAGNPGLAAAAARVREARALVVAAGADRLPSLDARAGSSRNRRSETVEGGAMGQRVTDFVETGFDASWELDLFGRAAKAETAAELDAAAAEDDRRAVLVSLRAEVVRAYASLRGAQRLLAVLEGSAATAKSTAELTRSRAEGGLATNLDVARAEAQHASFAAAIPPVAETIEVEIHRLGILCGETPTALAPRLATPAPLTVWQPKILVGTPAAALARRPDVRRDERRVAAEEARAGVARADLYPRISLSAALGLESERPGDLVNAPSRVWSLARTVTWPVFDGGRRRSGVDAADARLDQARESHRETCLVALGEVEDALTAYLRNWERRDALAAAVEAQRRAVSLAADVQKAGLADFLDVLDAERSLFDAEADLAKSETQTATRLVQLMKALGAGGEIETASDAVAVLR